MAKNKKLNKKKRISPSTVALIGAFVITIGGFFILYNFISDKKLFAYDYMNEQIYDNRETEIYDVNTTEVNTDEEETNTKNYQDIESYIGYLEIPKIKFRRGFYNITSKLNTVEANIEIIKGSDMPDVTNGNLIIAGHSGTGWKAFFKNLYKLEVGDEAIVTYAGINYKYKITNIYKQKNTGTVSIKRNYDKTTLTLITCTKDDSSTQTIYIAELDSVE
ncbi:MAG TPA: sortase [Candidatus Onthousia excrementipullorum]|uniref:Sortase n=1 Tax=Candidatus Onthousia excrementipullorum TaxID=2840884 RepID=A0A9D1DTR0_9FIRM|nr:sortase [Candidatus Onthousia excrementipullorum]